MPYQTAESRENCFFKAPKLNFSSPYEASPGSFSSSDLRHQMTRQMTHRIITVTLLLSLKQLSTEIPAPLKAEL